MKKRKNSAGCAGSSWERLQRSGAVFLAGFLACICILISGCGSAGMRKEGGYTDCGCCGGERRVNFWQNL